ncbi:MAG: hypothetical protein ACMZ7B_05030 [Balneola sp.]
MVRFILILSAVGLTACATHAPMSEMVMFKNPEKESERLLGASVVDGSISEEEFLEKSQRNYEDYPATSIGLFAGRIFDDKFALSTTLGSATGADITYRLGNKNYLTGSLSLFFRPKVIFQRAIVNTRSGGISLGVFGAVEEMYYSQGCSTEGCLGGFLYLGDKPEYLFKAGFRSRYLFRTDEKYGFSGDFELGYLPEVSEPFVGFSASFVLF